MATRARERVVGPGDLDEGRAGNALEDRAQRFAIGEVVSLSLDEELRDGHVGEVRSAKLLGLAGRMERVAEIERGARLRRAALREEHRGHATAHALSTDHDRTVTAHPRDAVEDRTPRGDEPRRGVGWPARSVALSCLHVREVEANHARAALGEPAGGRAHERARIGRSCAVRQNHERPARDPSVASPRDDVSIDRELRHAASFACLRRRAHTERVLRTVIVKTGTTLPALRARRGDFEDWIASGLGVERGAVDVVDVQGGDAWPSPAEVGSVIVTGSAAMVTDRKAWSVAAGEWIAAAMKRDRPVLAICYGHQLVADALGGTVGTNPRGREIGTIEVELTAAASSDPLFEVLPSRPRFQATHLESVLALPDGARLLASSALDPIQAYAVGGRAWCVQFHPELDADAIRAYIEARRAAITTEGLDPDALLRAAHDTGDGRALLRRFAEISR